MTLTLVAADLMILGGAIYSMAPDRAVYRAIANRRESFWRFRPSPAGSTGGFGRAGDSVVYDSALTLLPGFIGTPITSWQRRGTMRSCRSKRRSSLVVRP